MRKQSIGLLLISMLGGWMMSSSANANLNSRLTVEINGLRNQKGTLCFSLFSNEQGFPNRSDRAVASRCVAAKEASVSVIFDRLVPGNYAVAVIHDANDDGKLNIGFLGIPKEGFGFSRNPKIGIGAPSFQDTAILVAGESSIQIELNYLL
ncbi:MULTISPECIES: DUF2141 domain-containing protein [Nostoc]|uniref:DUF2141 domain-containing protein n=1 Tax=Nostoc paludosum FACHB-159 TaxID=2692908 RepID=A0ABR8K4N6_9NOSO|nr:MULTISPECIES: DUF2141 domain-containing protein [Nostoc]MBD2678168.1 DUF2141 domain-containing protein [Nostoc sp. FACHB-857]MBD2734428.1 DUF2141 domain-containing protein [Nostoc paludosum FACHB-159]